MLASNLFYIANLEVASKSKGKNIPSVELLYSSHGGLIKNDVQKKNVKKIALDSAYPVLVILKTLTRDRRTQRKISLQIGISDVFLFLNLQCLSHREREADKGHHAHSQWRSSRPRRQMATKQLKSIFAWHRVP